jgi:hypothetical protein
LESNGEDGGGVNAVEVPDYPRPRSPNSAAKASGTNAGVESEPAPTAEEAANQQQAPNGGGGGGNRQERRRQERRREKSHRDGEDSNMNNNNVLSSHNDAMYNHLNKRFNDRNLRNDPMGGSKGVRITQPAGKFMA